MVCPLCDHFWCCLCSLGIKQCHCIVGWVGHDHVCLRNFIHHTHTSLLHTDLALTLTNMRVTKAVLHFVFNFLLGHALLFHELKALVKVIHNGNQRSHCQNPKHHLEEYLLVKHNKCRHAHLRQGHESIFVAHDDNGQYNADNNHFDERL